MCNYDSKSLFNLFVRTAGEWLATNESKLASQLTDVALSDVAADWLTYLVNQLIEAFQPLMPSLWDWTDWPRAIISIFGCRIWMGFITVCIFKNCKDFLNFQQKLSWSIYYIAVHSVGTCHNQLKVKIIFSWDEVKIISY